nr:XRE family transcriptional regulator [uncultured bacterium]
MDKKLIEFLIKAKRKTYAGKGAETVSSREKSHDLVYRENNFMYYDTYLGGEKFAGEEALWIADNPYWSMNYIGRVTGENFNVDFLKEALLNVPFEKPFRSPEKYEDGSYEYKCSINGNFDWFQGKEIISFCGKEIYECYFHGGLIK